MLNDSNLMPGAPLIQIITLTINPAIDISTSVVRIAPFSKLRCAPARRDPGGGGINIARVVTRLGGEAAAIYTAGGAIGQLLRRLMDREGVRSLAISTSEETREDFTVFEETIKQQYRFVLPGAPLSEQEWQECLRVLACTEHRPKFIVASGSLPPGVPEDFFGRVACVAKELDAKVIVDTAGMPLKAALKEGVYLIKPNLREFQELTRTDSSNDVELIDAGRELIDRGLVELVAISLGPNGALFIGRDQPLRAAGLPIKPASVVGAGDSFLGAMIWSLTHDNNLETALRYGVAAGSAALINPGTELCQSKDVRCLASQVIVRPVSVINAC
jgi:6-phosphofructokinase 2